MAGLRDVGVDNEEDARLKTFNKDSKQLGYLKFLIQNNYIDEKYMEYTSGYESKMLSSIDEEFIRKVQQGEQDFNHIIDNPENVINQLRESSFSDPAILNNTILANLKIIESQTKNNKFSNIKALLNRDVAKEAIRSHIQSNEEIKVIDFLKTIIDGNVNVCGRLLSDNQLAKEKKDIVILALIESTSDYAIHNFDGSLSTFIADAENYEELLEKTDLEKVKIFLSQITPRIETLKHADNVITKYIIENNMYQINVNNLEKALGVMDIESGFYKKNYAYISKDEKVKAHIDTNLNEYVKNVFVSLDNKVRNNEEESSVAIDFINRGGIESLQQFEIIKKYIFTIDKIDEYAHELQSILLEFNRVKPTCENILLAYQGGIDFKIIKDFILCYADAIEGKFEWTPEKSESEKDRNEKIEKVICESLFVDLANATYTGDELLRLKKVALKISGCYKLDEKYTKDEGLSALIAEGKINYNSEDIKLLLDKQKSLQQYVIIYDKELNEDFDEFFKGINAQGLKTLILCKEIKKVLKQKLITAYGEHITAVNGFEKQYYQVISANKLKIPTVLLMRFKDCASLTKNEKIDLAVLTSDKEERTAMPLFRSYMENVFPELENASKAYKIDPTDQERNLLTLYAKTSGRELTNHRDGKITVNKT